MTESSPTAGTERKQPRKRDGARPVATQQARSQFDADLSGAVLNLHLLVRLMAWLRPYRVSLMLSAVLILLASFVSVVMEVVISLVLVDYIIRGEGSSVMPDLGMVDLTQWIEGQLHIEPIFAAGLIFFLLLTIYAIAGHAHRMTLISSIVRFGVWETDTMQCGNALLNCSTPSWLTVAFFRFSVFKFFICWRCFNPASVISVSANSSSVRFCRPLR